MDLRYRAGFLDCGRQTTAPPPKWHTFAKYTGIYGADTQFNRQGAGLVHEDPFPELNS
jgi:hypothetical protein